MPNLHLLTQTFSQARHASGTDQFNGLGPPLTQRLPGGMVEDAVIGEIRRLLRTPEAAHRVSKVLRRDRPDLGEADVTAALAQFDKMWTALIPAEQARVVQLLVARVTVGEAGLAVDLRHEGLGAIAALVAPPRKQVA